MKQVSYGVVNNVDKYPPGGPKPLKDQGVSELPGGVQYTLWIKWITYIPSKDSPIFTTSPAPIVIHRSPVKQFCSKKFSISPNEEKQ